MGRVFNSFEEYDVALDNAIAQAMNSDSSRVQINVKEEIVKMAETFVYNLYPNPFYLSRRDGNGGILDTKSYGSKDSRYAHRSRVLDTVMPGNVMGSGKGFTAYITADAEWQQKFGADRKPKTGTLVEVLETNGLYHHKPFHKPYMELAENNYGTDFRFGKDLVAELEENGF